MRFTKPFWEGIADGSITLAFRYWKRPTVVAGRPYRTGGGRVEALAVEQVQLGDISEAEARKAGYATRQDLLQYLGDGSPDRSLYKVVFKVLDEPDPRETLANDSNLTADSVAEISARLERFDRASKAGPWTHTTLKLIEQNPARRAPDLAEMVERETKPFKLDVRKLKNLGLTRSLKVGYELSPRGSSYLALK